MFTKSRPNIRAMRALAFLCVLSLSLAALPKFESGNAARAVSSKPTTQSRGEQLPDATDDPAAQARAQEAYGKLSLQFEANEGQSDPQVNFIARANGATVFLTNTAAVFVLRSANCGSRNEDAATRSFKSAGAHPQVKQPSATCNPKSVALRMNIEGSNDAPEVQGTDELPGKVNYFIGKDPDKWHTSIPTFSRVQYAGIYPGVDLVYYGAELRQLEYDFVIKPGADPSQIALKFEGADGLAVDANGDLVIETSVGTVRQHKPLVYQELGGARREVGSGYEIRAGERVSFRVGAYDASKPLVIDPVLAYSTFLGGSNNDESNAIAVDSSGNAYVAGDTFSANFPTANAIQGSNAGSPFTDAFVTKLNAAGSALIYSTYLGGSSGEDGNGIAVDAGGNAYVTGQTFSDDFPKVNAFQSTFGGFSDAFVTKLNATGSALIYSTYLGGTELDIGLGIAVDAGGNTYVTGDAFSDDFPRANAFQSTFGGSPRDAFVAKLNAAGSALIYSTYLGGLNLDSGTGVAADAGGNAYVIGFTQSPDFPKSNAFQSDLAGTRDAFVTKLNAAGSALIYSTYLGGPNSDTGIGIAVDAGGNAYVTGFTDPANFPLANALQPDPGGEEDAFVTKLNAAGSALIYSTYLGGTKFDIGTGIAVDAGGNAYISGVTESADDFPKANAFQSTFGGPVFDAFVTKLNAAGSALIYSSYLGGIGTDEGHGIAADSAGNAYVVGTTKSANFPVTPNAFQPGKDGGSSTFVSKIGSFSISGRVVDSAHNGIAGVTVILSGSNSDTKTTDGNGNFALLNTTPGGNYTVTPTKSGFTFSPPSITINALDTNQELIFVGTGTGATPTPTPLPAAGVHFEFDQYIAAEDCGSLDIAVIRTGDTASSLTVDFATSDDTAKQKGDYTITLGTLAFASGETRKTVTLLITEDAFVEGDETFNLNLFNLNGPATLEEPSRATIIIADDDTTATNVNPIDDTHTFVCQHYHDFFNREPDTSGLLFWINNIDSCGADAACREAKRIDTSAAFFLSIEFQGTGFYAIRLQRAAFGKRSDTATTRMTYQDLVRDTRQLGEGVIVGQPGADTQLEQNKQAYATQVVTSAAFIDRFPTTQTAGEYVDALYTSAQVTPTATERTDAITAFGGGGTDGRVAALRQVAESQTIVNAEFNAGFVLLQYHGYMRRNPTDLPDTNDSGYQFWLAKLNSFGGDFRQAEMVKAFISSAEYRQRFGQ